MGSGRENKLFMMLYGLDLIAFNKIKACLKFKCVGGTFVQKFHKDYASVIEGRGLDKVPEADCAKVHLLGVCASSPLDGIAAHITMDLFQYLYDSKQNLGLNSN